MSSVKVEDRPVDSIIVEREARQRNKLDSDVKQLASSIERSGLLNPIIIHDDGRLVAGERRLEAHRQLARTHIRCTIFESLSPTDAYLIEIQENLQRKDLSWQDQAKAISTYHKLKLVSTHGQWTHLATANDIGLSEQQVGTYLTVAAELIDEEVAGCQTLRGALNLLTGRAERAVAAAQSRGLDIVASLPQILPKNASKEEVEASIMSSLTGDLDAPPKPQVDIIAAGKLAQASLKQTATRKEQTDDQPIQEADFCKWVENYTGEPFDVLHVDFPYKDYSGSNTRRTGRAHIAPMYASTANIFWDLLEAFLEHQDKIAYPVAHCVFWFDMEYYAAVRESFEKAGWKLAQPHPLIWTKPYQGVAADTKRRPRHCYETALLLSRGDRKLVRIEQDYYDCRVDEKLHANQKPQAMLRHFLRMLVDEHTAVLDPTCGSGSALAVARALGSPRILGLELDPSNVDIAKHILNRSASK
jgi:ParB/RepB/Spo0J family partition protein